MHIQWRHSTRTAMIFARVLHVLVNLFFLACLVPLGSKNGSPLWWGWRCQGCDGRVVKTLLVLVSKPMLSQPKGLCSYPLVPVAMPWPYRNIIIMIAFAHIWTAYILIKYLKNQSNKEKCYRYIFLAGLTIGFGTGVRMVFPVILIPIFLFAILDIFF